MTPAEAANDISDMLRNARAEAEARAILAVKTAIIEIISTDVYTRNTIEVLLNRRGLNDTDDVAQAMEELITGNIIVPEPVEQSSLPAWSVGYRQTNPKNWTPGKLLAGRDIGGTRYGTFEYIKAGALYLHTPAGVYYAYPWYCCNELTREQAEHYNTTYAREIETGTAPAAPVPAPEPDYTPAQIAAARDWIAECHWNDLDDEYELTAAEILEGMRRHYVGGMAQFITDNTPHQPQDDRDEGPTANPTPAQIFSTQDGYTTIQANPPTF